MRRLLYCLLPCALWAQTRPAPPIPKYEVKRATSPIVIDGKLDDKAWAAANTAELTFPWESQTGAKQKTVARLLWDDENLYVSYQCEDTDITAQFTQRDDPTWRDDAVEIFINPLPAQQTTAYIGLEMNARGVLYDYLNVGVTPSRRMFLQAIQSRGREGGDLDRRHAQRQDRQRSRLEPGGVHPLGELPGVLQAADGRHRVELQSKPMGRRRTESPHEHLVGLHARAARPHAPERFGEMRFVE